MPTKKKNTKHRTSKRQPGICARWSERINDWEWGFRILLPQSDGSKKEVHVHAFPTFEAALTAFQKIRQQITSARFGIPTTFNRPKIKNLIAERLRELHNSKEYVRASRVLNYWLQMLPADLLVEELDVPHLSIYNEQRLRDGVQPQSIDREMNIIVACINWARLRYKELRQWHPPHVPRLKFPKNSPRNIIPGQDYRALVEYLFRPQQDDELSEHYKARLRVGRILRFMNLTGTRTGECCRVKIAHVEWQYNRIQIIGTKTDEVRYVPLTPECAEVVRAQLAYNEAERLTEREKASPYLFTRSGNAPSNLYPILRRACEALGIRYGRKNGGLILYDSRHTLATELLQARVDLKTAGQILGHSDETMTLYYAHVQPETLEQAAGAVSQIEQRRLAPDDGNETGKSGVSD